MNEGLSLELKFLKHACKTTFFIVDIDECTTRTANCNGRDDYCINTRGGFKCETITCPEGFIKAPPRGRRGK